MDLEQGRIDRAQSFLQKILPLGKDGTEVVELTEVLAWCRQAARHVAAGKPSAALPLLRKVKAICASARWLDTAISDAKRAAEAYEELDAGPLGLSMTDETPSGGQRALGGSVKAEGLGDGVPGFQPAIRGRDALGTNHDDAARRNSESGGLPSKFVVQVDGVGSFLVFRDARITVGPISSSARPMVSVIADPHTPVVMIERVEGDYFVRSQTPIEVNGQSATERLLADGDRIVLSPRCSIRFHLPNPASTTALLTISGSKFSRPDIKQLILMDRDILIGPYANDHIRTEQVKEPVALFAQNGRLLCRTKESILVDGHSFDPTVGLALDKRVEIGKLSLVAARLGE